MTAQDKYEKIHLSALFLCLKLTFIPSFPW
jgi:hypothetical protein